MDDAPTIGAGVSTPSAIVTVTTVRETLHDGALQCICVVRFIGQLVLQQQLLFAANEVLVVMQITTINNAALARRITKS